ncbi:sensor histidine kinase [Pseudomonas tructae]|uniref:histidine kinase n=1 Tax=Pseudomonas tructae TaxID=2518644 RepID=A0A411MI29_9PSED|nr:hybrid sensor histidine kinase/response regulator [Pseudomonas tructae]QBF26380.1 sensor histidine kinase [Pseudomonas tructae]
MNQPNAFFERLANSSLRLHAGLTVLCATAVLLIGISYWGVQRTLEEQHDTVRFHFARLLENLHEQEAFLNTVSVQTAMGELPAAVASPLALQQALPNEGPDIVQGQQHSFSLPFSVKIDAEKVAVSQHPKIYTLGAHLADYYSAFWSASHFQSPQVFLFNVPDNFDIAVPAAGRLRGAGQIQGGTFVAVMQHVLQRLHDSNPRPLDGRVHWVQYNAASDNEAIPSVLGYINIDLASIHRDIQGASPWVVVASLLNLSQINNIERIMQWSIYDHFTLIAPSGQALIGTVKPQVHLHEGLNFNSDGLVFKVSSTGERPWSGIYVISVKSFLNYARWPLLGLLLALLAALAGGWAFNRWYKRRVVLPAHRAHESIAESEAFSRAVIDSAPTGLCVIRRSDHSVLLENLRAQQWQDSTKLISALNRQHDLTHSGQTDLESDGRHLHVDFISTRYHGEDVWLCAIHDVTRRVEDAAALEEARKDADSANEAKTRFLATMSHEIRTPLYGVLGTLELLGLTALEPRQRQYLDTIQRSSATLFQLISDVLDVSKIESGQMTLETQDFCPLELTEDTLRTYSAFAQAKGLQLYACIDATLPDRVRGDPLRIRQILNNLLSNAIKFTEHGRVVLRLRVVEQHGEAVSLQWQVSDSGIGISQAQQVQLFDPFYQVRDASSEAGAGLGLAICWWLCELMAGQLKVVSEPGLGSSFSLQLTLEQRPGKLADCPDLQASAAQVCVRAPTQELAQHLCAWLNRLGAQAWPAGAEMKPATVATLLVDMLPTDNQAPWPGTRIIAAAGAPNPPQHAAHGWDVDAHDVRAIAWAVYLAQQGADPEHQLPPPHPALPLNLRVLVAEDNPINQAIIEEQLQALGCVVTVADNGEQALAQWLPGLFDLVLTDVNMPITNGYELASALRQQDSQVPIIGVTANALREEGERCAAVGMNAWLVKPLTLHTLRTQLLKHCKAEQIISPPLPPPPQPASPPLQLSVKMRELFVRTLQQDMQGTLAALERGDADGVAQKLHSMAGSLAVVHAAELAQACAELECRLTGLIITPPLALAVRNILEQLSALLLSVE